MVQVDVEEERETMYRKMALQKNAMAPYMPFLRTLSLSCETCVEFGVRRASSTVALLHGGAEVHSVDVEWLPRYDKVYLEIQRLWPEWKKHKGSSIDMEAMWAIPAHFDLLLHDSLHTYDQVKEELALWAPRVRKYLVFHDSVMCGVSGQTVGTGEAMLPGPDENILGILPAIHEFLIHNAEWHIHTSLPRGREWRPGDAGLLVLKREP